MSSALQLRVADLDWLHDGPLQTVTWLLGRPRSLCLTIRVPRDAEGPFTAYRGHWVNIVFVDVFIVQLTGLGHTASGDEFCSCDARLPTAIQEHCQKSEAIGLRVPAVRAWIAFSSGSETAIVCERIELQESQTLPSVRSHEM
jgi:hypothetical protein